MEQELNDILKKLDAIKERIDHNSLLWIEFLDKLNEYSVCK